MPVGNDSPLHLKITCQQLKWEKGQERVPCETSHAVIVVAAKKTHEGSVVYFVDPNDPSDPQDPTKDIIYVISYDNLQKHAIKFWIDK